VALAGISGRKDRWCGYTAPASVKLLAAAALIEKLRALNFPHPADLGHGDLGGDRRQAVSQRHHPSICALRFAALCRGAFSITGGRALRCSSSPICGPISFLSSAARRLPMVLIKRPDVASLVPRWRRAAGTISALLGPVRGLPGPITRRCRAFYRARQPQRHYDRKLKLDVPAPPPTRQAGSG